MAVGNAEWLFSLQIKYPLYSAHSSARGYTVPLATGCHAEKKLRLGPSGFATPVFTGCAFVCTCTPSRSHAQNFTIFSVGRYAGLHTQSFARAGQKSSGFFSSVYHKCPRTTSKYCKNRRGIPIRNRFLCNKSPLIGHKHIQSGPFAYKVKRKRVKPQLLQAHRWCWCRSAEIHSHAGFLRSLRCG